MPSKFFDAQATNGMGQGGEKATASAVKNEETTQGEEQPKQRTVLEQDEELMLKLEAISGEGGGAGVEYEGGKAVGLKRGVRENMFRVI